MKQTANLSPEERKQLLAVLLQEARNRDLDFDPSKIRPKNVPFPKDAEGYYFKRDGKRYRAKAAQAGFINNSALFSLFVGSRGSGKTAAGAQKALRKIEQGFSGAVMNPDFENFRISTWDEFRRWIPWDNVAPRHRYMGQPDWYPHKPFTINFLTGASVICKGLKNPDSARGPNVNWLWYDEAGRDPDGAGWRIAVAAVRVGEQIQSWATATPNGVRHWMYSFFIKQRVDPGLEKILPDLLGDRELFEVFTGSMEENADNLDAAYYLAMNTVYDDGWEKQQEVGGEFVDKGTVLGDRRWFNDKKIVNVPSQLEIKKKVRYWDLAASEKKLVKGRRNDPDETVGTLLLHGMGDDSLPGNPNGDVFIIEDQVSGYFEWDQLLERMWSTALADGYFVEQWVEQEPAAGGKNQIAAIDSYFRDRCTEIGYPRIKIRGHRPEGDKIQRANIWFKEAKDGRIYLVAGKWNEKFLENLDGFPVLIHDDQVDSMSGARLIIAPIITWKDIPFRHINDSSKTSPAQNKGSSESQTGNRAKILRL